MAATHRHARRLPKGAREGLRRFLASFITLVLLASMAPMAPISQALAITLNRPSEVILQVGNGEKINVMKKVATIDSSKDNTELTFTAVDAYSSWPDHKNYKERKLIVTDAKSTTTIATTNSNTLKVPVSKLKGKNRVTLETWSWDGSKGKVVRRYGEILNVRLVNAKATEKSPSGGSSSGSSGGGSGGQQPGGWSFGNGLSYTFKNTGFKFLDNTTMTLNGLDLPLTYKHNADGTTTVGINCTPEDVTFLKAVKNGNPWEKYTTEKAAKATAKADKGWSGKEFGKWGGKKFDWQVMGYMEYNTKNPTAPRSINLMVSMGIKADGHAQYLCFTGTLTFTAGGKAMLTGKWSPKDGLSGSLSLGAYAGLELYIGLGLNYVASIGAYGKGSININFQLLPKSYLNDITLTGQCGAKAKVFGFTVYTWKILEGKKELYKRPLQSQMTSQEALSGQGLPQNILVDNGINEDGTATSPLTVSAETSYPIDSRDYLEETPTILEAQENASANSIFENVYGETELTSVTTNNGPVVACVADANQINSEPGRAATDRGAVVFSRRKADGTWTTPKIVDQTNNYADYTPHITTDGENCYIAYLAADSSNGENPTIGDVGKKLDVKVAKINASDEVEYVETVSAAHTDTTTMPASPVVLNSNDGLFVGWYTNQTAGDSGEVLGVSGTHTIKVFKRNATGGWNEFRSIDTEECAISSFDMGFMGNVPTAAWSTDTKLTSANFNEATSLNDETDPYKEFNKDTFSGSKVNSVSLRDASSAPSVRTDATNAQFAAYDGKQELTYATPAADVTTGGGVSIYGTDGSGEGEDLILDGSKVDLETTDYKISGDLGLNRAGCISFLKLCNYGADICSMLTTGESPTSWTSELDTTYENGTISDFTATYVDGQPLFVYTTTDEGLESQDDGTSGADIGSTTTDSLKHARVDDTEFDEYEFKTGQTATIEADVQNDGLVDLDGFALWKREGTEIEKVYEEEGPLAIDGTKTVEFTYQIPPKEEFTGERNINLLAAPLGKEVTDDDFERALTDEDAATIRYGGPSLSLEAEHMVESGQEYIVSTVTNDGMTAHGATLQYIDSNTDRVLYSVEVPELGEDECFIDTYTAEDSYFRRSGVADITVKLFNDGSQSTDGSGYELNNTDFVSTWDFIDDQSDSKPAFRLYTLNSGEHFYTLNAHERDVLTSLGWAAEGIGWNAPNEGTPVYRLYNPNAGDHHYTMNISERDMLVRVGWVDEGIGWRSDPACSVPVWREYNPNARAGAHNFTSSRNEHLTLVRKGWHGEGIAWYGL